MPENCICVRVMYSRWKMSFLLNVVFDIFMPEASEPVLKKKINITLPVTGKKVTRSTQHGRIRLYTWPSSFFANLFKGEHF